MQSPVPSRNARGQPGSELCFLVALGGMVSPRRGRGLGPARGLDPEAPQQGMEAVPLPGLGWGRCGGEGLAGRASTQRALLLLPDPIIPSPILTQGLGARQGKLRERCPCSAPPLGQVGSAPQC